MWQVEFDGDSYGMCIPTVEEYLRLRKLCPEYNTENLLLRQPFKNETCWLVRSGDALLAEEQSLINKKLEFDPHNISKKVAAFSRSNDGQMETHYYSEAFLFFRPCLIPLDDNGYASIAEHFAEDNPDGTQVRGGTIFINDGNTPSFSMQVMNDEDFFHFGNSDQKYDLPWIIMDGKLFLSEDYLLIKPRCIENFVDIFEDT